MESMGTAVALKEQEELSPEERHALAEDIAAHYSAVAYVPDTLETARRLFSGQP
jgi:hypothetical protein